MTEQEWLRCTNCRELFDRIEGKVSERKLRLFAVACCRRVWHLLTEEGRRAVEVTENWIEGTTSRDELLSTRQLFRATELGQPAHILRGQRYRPDLGGVTADSDALWAAQHSMRESADVAAWNKCQVGDEDFTAAEFATVLHAELAVRCRLLHEMLGPLPFRPLALSNSARSPNVVAIANTIYVDRSWADTPILADALEEAGCDDADILGHLRGPGPHIRGCWAIDLLLNKT